MLDEILPSSPEEELCKIESTSRSSGDDNDGLGTLCCGQALGDILTMPHDENRLVCGCLPPPLPFLVFLIVELAGIALVMLKTKYPTSFYSMEFFFPVEIYEREFSPVFILAYFNEFNSLHYTCDEFYHDLISSIGLEISRRLDLSYIHKYQNAYNTERLRNCTI